MTSFTVILSQTVSTAMKVEADNYEDAVEEALRNAPSPTNSTNDGIDPSGEWIEAEVINNDTGETAWSEADDDRAKRAMRTAAAVELAQAALSGACLDEKDVRAALASLGLSIGEIDRAVKR